MQRGKQGICGKWKMESSPSTQPGLQYGAGLLRLPVLGDVGGHVEMVADPPATLLVNNDLAAVLPGLELRHDQRFT